MVDAREFHRRTNHSPRSVRESDHRLNPATKPHPFKRYLDRPTEPLHSIRPPQQPALAAVAHAVPDPLSVGGRPAPRDRADRPDLDRETLATICYEAAGITQRVTARDGTVHFFRAASCTGNLHHVDLYAVCADLPDLDAGLYHFDPVDFALDVLREGDYRRAVAESVGLGAGGPGDAVAERDEADDRTDDRDDDPHHDTAATVARAPLTLVATSEWARNAWKYRDRTYRHAFWDAGTVLANGLAAAHALDHRAEVVAAFADDPVADLVGVDPEVEAPIALLPVGGGRGAPIEPAPDAPPVEPIDPPVDPATDDPADTSFVHDAWRQSALADGAAAAAFRRACHERGSIGLRGGGDAGDGSRAEPVALDPVDAETASARPLHATIRRRGSCREYAEAGPTRRQVATVLDRALGPVPGDWRAAGAAGDDAAPGQPAGLAYNDAYLLATGIEGLADGAYHVRPAASTLHRVGDATVESTTHLALDQQWAGDAHANVYLLADVDAVVEALGNRGYRLAQLEAGIVLGRLYLATYAHRDLGGTGLTFYDGLVAEALAPPGSGQTPRERSSREPHLASLAGTPSDERSESGEPGLAQLGQTPTTLFAFGRRGD